MQGIGILTDSTAYLPEEIIKQYAIHVLPLNLQWDGKTYRDDIDITPAEFYARLEKEKTLPTISQSSTQAFSGHLNTWGNITQASWRH